MVNWISQPPFALNKKISMLIRDLIIFTGHGLFDTILSMTSCFWSVSPLPFTSKCSLNSWYVDFIRCLLHWSFFIECWNRFNCKFMVGWSQKQWFWTWQVSIIYWCLLGRFVNFVTLMTNSCFYSPGSPEKPEEPLLNSYTDYEDSIYGTLEPLDAIYVC